MSLIFQTLNWELAAPFAQLDGDIIADSSAVDSSSIFALAPLGMVRWNQYTEEAF